MLTECHQTEFPAAVSQAELLCAGGMRLHAAAASQIASLDMCRRQAGAAAHSDSFRRQEHDLPRERLQTGILARATG
jgi:hypothetical protein